MQQPITLYLDLEEGAKPDLATVARAALAFDAAVKEVTYVLDPSLIVRLEFQSGTEGSLKLNSLIRSLKDKAMSPVVLRTVAAVIIGWFAADVRSYLTEQVIESMIRDEMREGLSDVEIAKIAKEVAKALKGEVGEKQVNKVYEELLRDEGIKGVGVTTNSEKKPRVIVPRERFKERSGSVSSVEESSIKRSATKPETVTLISPVLLPGERKWRFSLHGFEFGASVKDQIFLQKLLSGLAPVPMVAGITMDVLLETKEEKIEGVWTVKERNIVEVIGTKGALIQTRLNLPPQS